MRVLLVEEIKAFDQGEENNEVLHGEDESLEEWV